MEEGGGGKGREGKGELGRYNLFTKGGKGNGRKEGRREQERERGGEGKGR